MGRGSPFNALKVELFFLFAGDLRTAQAGRQLASALEFVDREAMLGKGGTLFGASTQEVSERKLCGEYQLVNP